MNVHIGASGAGHAVKAVNNCIMGAQIMLAGEACATLVRHGVDPAKALAAINTSSGRSWATMQRLPDHVLPRTFDYNFALELLRKDVGICKAMINAIQSILHSQNRQSEDRSLLLTILTLLLGVLEKVVEYLLQIFKNPMMISLTETISMD